MRSFHVANITGANLKAILRSNVAKNASIMTDDYSVYDWVKNEFPSHDIIRHSSGSYSRREGEKRIHTNSAEESFSILKRGMIGTFHHVSKQHLHRYLLEFDFRYNLRHVSDGIRALHAIKEIAGKRLMYRDSSKLRSA